MANGNAGIHVCATHAHDGNAGIHVYATHAHVIKIMTK